MTARGRPPSARLVGFLRPPLTVEKILALYTKLTGDRSAPTPAEVAEIEQVLRKMEEEDERDRKE